VAVKGVVYDVTRNQVYKSDGTYSVFTGRDATVALGKMAFDKIGEGGWQAMSQMELSVLD
jgi:hypothetical protein